MLMVGRSNIYLSHLPMFHSPHEYQAIVEVDLGEAGDSVYLEDRKSHPLENVYTLQPQEKFVLPAMIQNPTTFVAKIYRGHFERGGTVIAESVPVKITKVIYFKKFETNASKPAGLYYILFGSSREQFVAHLITAKPDFDQVLRVEVADDQFSSVVASTMQHELLKIPGMPNDAPVSDTEPLHAIPRHALVGQFIFCFLVLCQVHQAHAAQHIRRLRELNVVVTDNLHSVAPRVPEIKEPTVEYLHTGRLERLASCLGPPICCILSQL
ncbi:MAG: hypothetical protein WCD69_11120 [Xanthobacteraceae bacterium]